MNIHICYFTELSDIVTFTENIRKNGTSDVVIVFKKETARDGIAISNDFYDENINHDFVESNNIDVQRSYTTYGKYGNVLSLPNITLFIMIPMKTEELFGLPYVECAIERLFCCEKREITSNDFLKDGKKVLGRSIYSEDSIYQGIASLSNIPEYIDGIYSDQWRESGKELPSTRVMGYAEAVGKAGVTIEDFADDLRFRMNEQLKNTVQDIVLLDYDEGGIEVGRL